MSADWLDGVDESGPLRELRVRARQETFLMVVEYAIMQCGKIIEPWAVLDAPSRILYALALQKKDWREADRIYVEALWRRNPSAFRSILRAEGWAKALNVMLAEELAKTRVLLRYADLVELASYVNGTFESRWEYGGHRGYKAFSLYVNHFVAKRPVTVRVPIESIRGVVVNATYTALPRPLPPSMERMGDGKHIAYAGETECRVPDGTRVPPSTQILVQRGSATAKDLQALGSVADVCFI